MAELNLLYVHSGSIGYGRLGVELARGLRRMGVEVWDDLPSPEEPSGKKCNVACWVSVPTHARGWWSSQHPALFSMWEFDRLPESFRCTLHNFEKVIVPSLQNLELFSQYHENVVQVPLGFDPKVWKYTPRNEPGQYFNFLIGGSGTRKGTDLAFAAFNRVFPDGSWGDGPIPRLIMKSPKSEPFTGDRIERVGGRITAQEEVALYEKAHVYLQPSRGEGWGLQPLQAIAQGIPTVLTDAHGHAEFAHLGYGLDTKMVPAAFSVYGDAGDWWEPDFDQLCGYMEYLYNNYEHAVAFAETNAEKALEFTWANTATKFVDAIGRDLLEADFTESEWFAPEEKLYPVKVRQHWKADICGTIYLFEPGRTYYERSDVLRILFEAGQLDPSCLSTMTEGGNVEMLNTGLLPSQVERIPDYSASMGWCPTCSQRLQSGPTRAEYLMAERA